MKFLLLLCSVLVLVLATNVKCSPTFDHKFALHYLKTYDYLSSGEKLELNNKIRNHESIDNDERFQKALKNLQRNGNKKITGKLDKNTISLMKMYRCGVSDGVLNVKRHKRYTLMSSKWDKTEITWSYKPKHNDPLQHEKGNIRRIIGEAFKVWEQDTIMKFYEVHISDDPDILVSFENPRHSDVDPFPFGEYTLAHAFQPGSDLGGDAHFNRDVNWDFTVSYDSNPRDGMVSFFGVALHELGHSLGLGHSLQQDAVMYEFYSKSTATLAEDDIRGMQHIYGVPRDRKFKPTPKKVDDDEDQLPVWGVEKREIAIDKCNTSYDAIAMIDNELMIFKHKFVFGPTTEVIEIRKLWNQLPQTITHVDAVYQAQNGEVLFFIDTHVYIFESGRLEVQTTLQNLGLGNNVRKIDAIFKWGYKNQPKKTFIFSGESHWILDETNMHVKNKDPYQITKIFRDVYDIDTGFSDKDEKLYFIKGENFYEFDDNTLRMKRMRPGLSANKFMYCNIEDTNNIIAMRFGDDDNNFRDYIDLGPIKEDAPEIDLYHYGSDTDDANSIKNVVLLTFVFVISLLLF